jgi:hypothetical protein
VEELMGKRTYHGSCHCKRVAFEVDLDLSSGTGRCNCSYCAKIRNWSAGVAPDQFRLVSGKDDLGDYTRSPRGHHCFCKHCGVGTHTWGNVPQIGGDYVSVRLAALDDISPAELAAAPVRYMNGRDDDWFHEPAETRHL